MVMQPAFLLLAYARVSCMRSEDPTDTLLALPGSSARADPTDWAACLEAEAHYHQTGQWGSGALGSGWVAPTALALASWTPPQRPVEPTWWQQTGLSTQHQARPAAWLLRLRHVGREVERRARSSWRATHYAPDPTRDASAAALWAGFLAGTPWALRAAWDAAFARDAIRSFRAVGLSRRLPTDRLDRAVSDLREAWFYAMLDGTQGPAGHAWLAARVLETADSGPVTGLLQTLSAEGLAQLTRCAAHRGALAETLRHLFPDRVEPLSRARALKRWLDESPARGEVLLDLHTLRRVLVAWDEARGDDPWIVVAQNRGRLRGRIRAVRAGESHGLLDAILSLDALHARTAAAVRRLAWAWAWDELARDFAFDLSRGLATPCADARAVDAWSSAEVTALRAWVCLVILRGRLDHLQRWVSQGTTQDRDSTWARLLTDALPASLADPGTAGRARTYRRVRTELRDQLPSLLVELQPRVAAVAAVPAGRGAKSKVLDALRPCWSDDVPLPASGFPSMISSAKQALEIL
jgi:hypothetical protein